MTTKHSIFVGVLSIAAGAALFAQGRNIGGEWPAAQGDAQRTNWLRSDPNISIDTLSKPGFELQWKAGLQGQRGLRPAVQGVTVNGVTLFTPLSIITGGNGVIAIDNDTGETFWYKSFGAVPAAAAACASAPVAATRQTTLEQPAPTAPRAGGAGAARGGGYSSSVGNPGEGVPVPVRAGGAGGRGVVAPGAPAAPGAAPAAQAPANPAGAPPQGAPGAAAGAPGAAPARGGGGGGGGFGRPSGVVYAVARDGTLHVVGLPSSKDMQKPAPFVPAGARVTDPIAVNDVLYASTTGKCGGTVDAVYAIDLASDAKPVASYKTTGSPVGTLALLTDGTVVVAVTNGVVTLDAKTLAVKHSYTDAATTVVTGPLVFRHKDKDVIAVGTKAGQILLLDANTLAAPSVNAAFAAAGPVLAGEALSFFQEYSPAPVDAAAAAAAAQAPAAGGAGGGRGAAAPAAAMVPGQAWLLAATNNSVVAWKVVDQGGKLTLQQGWTSRALNSPVPPVIVNNVVFAVSSGKPATAAGAGTPAVLYALNALTGKELWNSGTTIKSYMPGRALWASNSQVYVGGNEGAVYAFGFSLDRR